MIARTTSLLLALGFASPALAASMHPAVELLDSDGEPVLTTGGAVSPMQTCGDCHDTVFIEKHGFHHSAGFMEPRPDDARPWDTSPGLYGRWDPVTYDRLSAPGDPYPDLDHAGWIQRNLRHAGGGPAAFSGFAGPDPANALEVQVTPQGSWDFAASGVVEANCFLCHTPAPDNAARVAELKAGRFEWAATATLAGVEQDGTSLLRRPGAGEVGPDGESLGPWVYSPELFDAEGKLSSDVLEIRDPASSNCGLCHGTVGTLDDPIRWEPEEQHSRSDLTGQIISPQRIRNSHMNVEGKAALGRPWDVHAERMIKCSKCHQAANNPAGFLEERGTRPDHLRHDARTLDIGEYIKRPSHDLGKGHSTQGTVADSTDFSMRRCEDCHDASRTHEWLPYRAQHMQAMLCETCHIPRIHAPARQSTDWTVLDAQGQPRVDYRGVRGDPAESTSLVTGYVPAFLKRPARKGGEARIAPHNLVTSWFWVQNKGGREAPVRRADLRKALLQGQAHHPAVLRALDEDGDGALSHDELRLDTTAKVDAVRSRLEAVGVESPRIVGEIQPFGLHHDVATGDYVIKDCAACHVNDSHLAQDMVLTAYAPAGAVAEVVRDAGVALSGEIISDERGLVYRPSMLSEGLYIIGHDTTRYADLIGLLALIATLLGVTVHGLGRVFVSRKHRSQS